MMSVLKNVGKGILYIIGLPFFLLILVLTGVAGIFVLVYMFFKSIILFFTGRSLYEDLPEDKEAKRRLGILPPEPVSEPQAQTEIKVEKQPSVSQPLEPEDEVDSNDPFYVPEYLKSQEQKQEVEEQKEIKVEQKPAEEIRPEPQRVSPRPITVESKEEKEEEEPVFEQKTSQNTNIFSISDVDDMDDSDDDNSDSGININFE